MPWNSAAAAVEGSLFVLHRKCRESIFRLSGDHFSQKSDPNQRVPVLAPKRFKTSFPLLGQVRKHTGAKYGPEGTGPGSPDECQVHAEHEDMERSPK